MLEESNIASIVEKRRVTNGDMDPFPEKMFLCLVGKVDSCLERKVDSGLVGEVDSCLEREVDLFLDREVDSCPERGVDSCLERERVEGLLIERVVTCLGVAHNIVRSPQGYTHSIKDPL